MNSEKATKLVLLIFVGFAAIMVFLSFIFANNDNLQTIILVFISIWLIPFSYLINAQRQST